MKGTGRYSGGVISFLTRHVRKLLLTIWTTAHLNPLRKKKKGHHRLTQLHNTTRAHTHGRSYAHTSPRTHSHTDPSSLSLPPSLHPPTHHPYHEDLPLSLETCYKHIVFVRETLHGTPKVLRHGQMFLDLPKISLEIAGKMKQHCHAHFLNSGHRFIHVVSHTQQWQVQWSSAVRVRPCDPSTTTHRRFGEPGGPDGFLSIRGFFFLRDLSTGLLRLFFQRSITPVVSHSTERLLSCPTLTVRHARTCSWSFFF